MSNIERKYAYYDQGVLPAQGEKGITYLTLYSSGSGNIYDGWIYDPDNKIPVSVTERTFGYRNPEFPQYCWDDEVVVDLSNAQNRQESSEFAQGRVVSFNTNVSPNPIVLQDIDTSVMTEDERERLATTVLFCAIPLVEDAYIQAQVEIQCKCNLSEDNTSGEMRVEAFYILNDESDRTMRPNPVHTFMVCSANERHTLPLLYFNPALKHDVSNYIGVKLICTGGTAEIGISDDPDYGDAIITITSAGLTGDKIDESRPRRIWIEGEQLVPMGYIFNKYDYDVFCEYDDGSEYLVTHFCEITPPDGTRITDEYFLVEARYMGLHASLRVAVDCVFERIELSGLQDIHGSYTLDISDYTVLGYTLGGDIWDITDMCTYYPEMGTTISQDTTLVATYVNPGPSAVSDSLEITAHAIEAQASPHGGLVYTLYDDDYLVISGEVNTNTGSNNQWKTFGRREGIAIPYKSLVGNNPKVGENKWTVEWQASGAPSAILFGASPHAVNPDLNVGIGVTRLVGFSGSHGLPGLDCSQVLWAEFCGQPYLVGSNLKSINLGSNNFTNPASGQGYENQYLITSKASTCTSSPLVMHDCGIDAFDNAGWDLSNVKLLTGLFYHCQNLKIVRLSGLNSVVSTANMFSECVELETVEIDGITYNIYPGQSEPYTGGSAYDTSIDDMFYDCVKLEDVRITNADYTNIKSMKRLFYNCEMLNDDSLVVAADIMSTPVKYFNYTFYNCKSIHDLEALRNADMSEALTIQDMFSGCEWIDDIEPISGWDVSKVYDFSRSFYGCNRLKLIALLSNWDMFHTVRSNPDGTDTVTITSMFARSPSAAAIGDDFLSSHILDAASFEPDGIQTYVQNQYSSTGSYAISLSISNIALNYLPYYGPVNEVKWDVNMTYDSTLNVYYPSGLFGGTDWRMAIDPNDLHQETYHMESNSAYGLPSWYYWYIEFVRSHGGGRT